MARRQIWKQSSPIGVEGSTSRSHSPAGIDWEAYIGDRSSFPKLKVDSVACTSMRWGGQCIHCGCHVPYSLVGLLRVTK